MTGLLTISRVVPVAGGGGVQPGSVLLHDDAGHDVFKRLLQLCQTGQTGLDHAVSPLVHFCVLNKYIDSGKSG